MEVIIKGDPEEIAALVVAIQGQQVTISDDALSTAVNRIRQIQDQDQSAFSP